jgi:serine/threonine-protein kinase
MEDSAYHLSLAERWIVKASLHATQKDAFSNPTFGDDDLDIAYSTYNHQVGIYGVQAFIAYAKGDFIQVNQSVAMILNASEGEVRGEDLTLDALSISLLFIHLLQRDVGNIIELKLREEMEHRIELIVLEYLEEPSLGAFSLEPKQVNLGMAHGVAGRLYTILKWCSYKNMMPSKLFFKKLDALIALKIPYGRGSCIPWQGVEQKSFNTMSGWCNGSSGMAMLLCEVVKITEKKSYLEVAKKFVFHCWEDGSSVANLCCGLAGRAYALAYYSEVSGESIWHRRALLLLNRAIEEVQQIDTEEMPKHSLYKGQLGVALATLEIEEQSGYSMPFFGSEL